MYCKTLLTVLFFGIFFSGFSQSFKAEIAVGATASQIDGDQIAGYDKAGLLAGGGVGLSLAKKWEAHLDLYFIQKGSHSNDKSPVYLNWKINYLELPVTVRWYFHPKIFVTGGIAADLLINSKNDYSGFGFVDNTNKLRSLNPVSVVGCGFRLSPRLDLNLRFLYSIFSFSKVRIQYNNNIAAFFVYRLSKE